MWIHLTARVSPPAPDLSGQEAGAWLWPRMRAAFPDAIAALLMPDHPHLVIPTADPDAARQRLARLLGHLGRAFGVGGRVALVPEAAAIRGGRVLARHIRYVALNPCRERLVRCPLAWPWSTHRDIVGACVDPWVTDARLARVLAVDPRAIAARHHAYVSGDPDARVEGTPFPSALTATLLPTFGLRAVAEAVASATRTRLDAIRVRGRSRALFVRLAFEYGWGHPERLAAVCDCCVRTIVELSRGRLPTGMDAVRLCSADPRLRLLPPELPQAAGSASVSASRGSKRQPREARGV